MNIINIEIYALGFSIILLMDYIFRFGKRLTQNSFTFFKFLASLIVLSLLNIIIASSPIASDIKNIIVSLALGLSFVPPYYIYVYVEDNYLDSYYYHKYKKQIASLIGLLSIIAFVVSLIIEKSSTMDTLYTANSIIYKQILICSIIPILITIIEYFVHAIKKDRAKNKRLLYILFICIIGIVIELVTKEFVLFSMTYMLCSFLMYSYRNEALINADYLTGLYNRNVLNDFRGNKRRRKGRFLAVYMIDIDKFKHINDTYGHYRGDEAIIAVAKTLQKSVRSSDYVIRYGGDEFVIIAKIGYKSDLNIIPEKIERNLEKYNSRNEIQLSLSIGSGVVKPDKDGNYSIDKIIDEVDAEMYKIKKAKKEAK